MVLDLPWKIDATTEPREQRERKKNLDKSFRFTVRITYDKKSKFHLVQLRIGKKNQIYVGRSRDIKKAKAARKEMLGLLEGAKI